MGVMWVYIIPDVNLFEAIYGRMTARTKPNDDKCATITFLTGVIQRGVLSLRLVIVFMNVLLEHLTHTGKPFGVTHRIDRYLRFETDQFDNVAFIDDFTVLAQGQAGAQILLDAVQEFEIWSNMKLNLSKPLVLDISTVTAEKCIFQL